MLPLSEYKAGKAVYKECECDVFPEKVAVQI